MPARCSHKIITRSLEEWKHGAGCWCHPRVYIPAEIPFITYLVTVGCQARPSLKTNKRCDVAKNNDEYNVAAALVQAMVET